MKYFRNISTVPLGKRKKLGKGVPILLILNELEMRAGMEWRPQKEGIATPRWGEVLLPPRMEWRPQKEGIATDRPGTGQRSSL